MGTLRGYARSSKLMKVSINYGGELYDFNLYEELKLNDADMDRELKRQATSYSFVTMLHKALINQVKTLEARKKWMGEKLYKKYKTSNKAGNGRNIADDLANAMVGTNKYYKNVIKKLLQAQSNRDTLATCVEAFEQRASLMQTISANNRKER